MVDTQSEIVRLKAALASRDDQLASRDDQLAAQADQLAAQALRMAEFEQNVRQAWSLRLLSTRYPPNHQHRLPGGRVMR